LSVIGKFLGALALTAIGLFIYLYFYLGMTKPVKIETGERGPFIMVYKNHMGAYHYIGPVIAAVEKWAADNNLRCELTFGEYIDDPASVDQDRLRSRGGCIFSVKPPVPLPEGFVAEDRPKQRFVIGTFEGSPSVGPFKVYPKVQDYIQTRRLKQSGAVIETYLIRGEKVTTEFLFPLEAF
jgi:AraC family transcriptional regulator